MLLSYWLNTIFANLYFIVKITYLMDAAAGRTGAKRGRKARQGGGGGRRSGLGSLAARPGGQDGFVIEEHKWLCLVLVGVENGFVWCFRSGGFEVGGDEAGDGVRHAVTFRFEE